MLNYWTLSPSFNFRLITFLMSNIGPVANILFCMSLSEVAGKNSLLGWRVCLRYNPEKNTFALSCSTLTNESGQPLNKSCRVLFNLAGRYRVLAGRWKHLSCGYSLSFCCVIKSHAREMTLWHLIHCIHLRLCLHKLFRFCDTFWPCTAFSVFVVATHVQLF